MHVTGDGRARGGAGRTKQRMLDSAVQLLRERGAAGVTVEAVLVHSGAPRGSVYHHFPGGRSELVLGAARQAGEFIVGLTEQIPAGTDPARALERFAMLWKEALAATDFLAGCPIVALALDSRLDDPEVTDLVRDVFARWQASLEDLLTGQGVPPDRARRLGTLVISAVEGAIVLCRAYRDGGPLDDVAVELAPLLAASVRDAATGDATGR